MISASPWADLHSLKGLETTEDQLSSVVLSPRGPSEDEEEDGEEDEIDRSIDRPSEDEEDRDDEAEGR